MVTFIDTHAHLCSKQFDDDIKEVVTSSKKAGVKKIIVPGFDLFTSEKAGKIAREFKGVCFATCGIHPYHANKVTDLFEARKSMIDIIKRYEISAIGEVGLDYHLYKNEELTGKKTQQKELFKIEIELALQYKLPIVLHCRDAWDDYIDILSAYVKDGLRGVSHCFEGGNLHLKSLIKMGFYIGFNGMITFNSRLPDLAKATPLDKILVETDSPFLAPVPFRGTRNEPKYIRIVVKEIAKVKGQTLDEIATSTTENATALFGLN